MQKAVFIDRDDTLIANDGDLGDPDEVTLLDGAAEGIRRLHEQGYALVVVTNQGGVARGRYGPDDVRRVHDRVHELLGREHPIAFYFCPFHPKGTVAAYTREHPWRKPAPGMLLAAATDLKLDLAASWMIGDQPRDAEAGRAAGCRTILLGIDHPADAAEHHVADFESAVRLILGADG
jgi:D-glycero-D-manno-heptose 1,7-bisphosphate phosphatase